MCLQTTFAGDPIGLGLDAFLGNLMLHEVADTLREARIIEGPLRLGIEVVIVKPL